MLSCYETIFVTYSACHRWTHACIRATKRRPKSLRAIGAEVQISVVLPGHTAPKRGGGEIDQKRAGRHDPCHR